MQAVLYGVRDAVARVAKCHEYAWEKKNLGLGLAAPSPEIHGALSNEASSKISDFAIGVASRLNTFPSSINLAILLAGVLSMAYACFIIRRANRKSSPGNYGVDRFYQALIGNSKLPIAILGRDIRCPVSFCGGAEILQECLSGPDAADVARALDALLRRGIGFESVLHGPGNREIVMRGTPVGRSCVIYFSTGKPAEGRSAILDALDAIPIPIWVRKADRSVAWANKAFSSIPGEQKAAENWEGSLAADVFHGAGAVIGRRSVVANDQYRYFQMNLAALSDGGLVGVATDVADMGSVEKRLRRTTEVCAQLVEHAPFAMAVFGSDQRLAMHNTQYALLWGLSESWLQSRPSKSEIIDRLRDERKLPEQKNFQQWKRFQLEPPAGADMKTTEVWHLPGGKSLRVVTTAYPEGEQSIMLEDISELLALEASLNRLSQVQKATIGALEDAVAIFGPDGFLMLHNPSFEELWRLTPSELSNRPHCADIARICDARMGRDEIWQVISDAISAMVPTTIIDIHETRREDGRHISLTLSRLPDGMTMAVFSDLSDLDRFEAMLEEDRPTDRDLNSQLPQTG
jgi:PAS domain-containing protein